MQLLCNPRCSSKKLQITAAGGQQRQADGGAVDPAERHRNLRETADTGDGVDREGSPVVIAAAIVGFGAFQGSGGWDGRKAEQVAGRECVVQSSRIVFAEANGFADSRAIEFF